MRDTCKFQLCIYAVQIMRCGTRNSPGLKAFYAAYLDVVRAPSLQEYVPPQPTGGSGLLGGQAIGTTPASGMPPPPPYHNYQQQL